MTLSKINPAIPVRLRGKMGIRTSDQEIDRAMIEYLETFFAFVKSGYEIT